MKRFTKQQLKDYCKNRPPAIPNLNSEPHIIVKEIRCPRCDCVIAPEDVGQSGYCERCLDDIFA